MDPTSYEYSGQMVLNCEPPVVDYCSYVRFEAVKYYPASEGRWGEHYIGIIDKKFILMTIETQEKIK